MGLKNVRTRKGLRKHLIQFYILQMRTKWPQKGSDLPTKVTLRSHGTTGPRTQECHSDFHFINFFFWRGAALSEPATFVPLVCSYKSSLSPTGSFLLLLMFLVLNAYLYANPSE